MKCRNIILLLASLWLSGCASQTGCQGAACTRPESQPDRLSVWWAPGLRSGLGNPENPDDHSLLPVEE
ncbi:HrpT family type III secretion system protein [Pseudomonas benzopyrenica]|uniref:HrpT family type III secretion system protein n=1 Tax=Pseudomonas TaxID=286 RepID=UPI0039C35236